MMKDVNNYLKHIHTSNTVYSCVNTFYVYKSGLKLWSLSINAYFHVQEFVWKFHVDPSFICKMLYCSDPFKGGWRIGVLF